MTKYLYFINGFLILMAISSMSNEVVSITCSVGAIIMTGISLLSSQIDEIKKKIK